MLNVFEHSVVAGIETAHRKGYARRSNVQLPIQIYQILIAILQFGNASDSVSINCKEQRANWVRYGKVKRTQFERN